MTKNTGSDAPRLGLLPLQAEDNTLRMRDNTVGILSAGKLVVFDRLQPPSRKRASLAARGGGAVLRFRGFPIQASLYRGVPKYRRPYIEAPGTPLYADAQLTSPYIGTPVYRDAIYRRP